MTLIDTELIIELPLSEVCYREDLYPRIKPDTATIQRYAENLEVLPPIEINQHNILIDGFHRWTAHRKAEAATIKAVVTQTVSEAEVYALAIERNAAHGLQMSNDDKKSSAIRLYAAGTGYEKEQIARLLSVSVRSVTGYLTDVDKQLREERKQKIFDMWMACHTLEEIATETDVTDQTIANQIKETLNLESLPNLEKVLANFQNEDFTPPIYNVWSYAKVTNKVGHFGNTEQRILENLLYLYTEPFDIVVDPFAGGGSTIDVCKHRLRRYWASDRKPIVERENEIRQLDIVTDGLPPLNKRWSDVSLTYLDPPYWKQAEGQYSDSPNDLANMPLEQFTAEMVKLVKDIGARQTKGVIALIIQPTQWKADERKFTDHVMHIINGVGNKKLVLENRISCPYSTEQCTPQMVEWAKANKKLLVLSRELIVWSVQP